MVLGVLDAPSAVINIVFNGDELTGVNVTNWYVVTGLAEPAHVGMPERARVYVCVCVCECKPSFATVAAAGH